MKYRLILLVLLMLCGLSVVRAQDSEPEYRLHMPSAKDYLSALPNIMGQIEREVTADQYGNNSDLDAMRDIVEQELSAKYHDLSDVPSEVFDNLTRYIIPTPWFTGVVSEDEWHYWRFYAALKTDTARLSKNKFQLGSYTVDINRIDFNGDGIDELLLQVHSEREGFNAWWVLEADTAQALGYKRVKTPDLWFSQDCDGHSTCAGAAQTLELRDLNADGLPEWAIALGSYCGYGECGGNLEILGWRNGAIIPLAEPKEAWDLYWTGVSGGGESPLLPPHGGWVFENTDQDAALEVIQQIPFSDNRGCEVVDNRTFDWSSQDDAFIRSSANRTYAESSACALRLGHEAMKAGDYSQAIIQYERAGRLFAADKNPDDYAREAQQYAEIRLMIAYALADQPDKVLMIQRDLEKQTAFSDAMAALLKAATTYHTSDDKITFCAAVNQAVQDVDYFSASSDFTIFGATDDVAGRPIIYVGNDFSPNNSGCNLEHLLEQDSVNLDIQANQSPVQGLIAHGWKYESSFSGDLNNDGINDWLIWTKEVKQAVLFVSSNTGYLVSLEYVSKPDSNTQLTIHQLDDHENPLLIELDTEKDADSDYCGDNKQVGSIDLRQWNGNIFRDVGNSVLCDQRTLMQLLPKPDVLQAWKSTKDGKQVEMTYQWDAAKKRFEAEQHTDFIPTIQDFNRFDCYQQIYAYCGFQYDAKVEAVIFPQILAKPDKAMSHNFLAAIHYSHALVLEALNRPDKALAEYVTIYKNAPESAWGKLAALHLECVANCAKETPINK